MNICRFFITRPIATIVLMSLITLFGYLHLSKLPIREYPILITDKDTYEIIEAPEEN